MTAVATLIGDVVGSRGAADRGALHRALTQAIASVNGTLDPVVPLRITVGDEYQGAFAEVGSALVATLRLRLAIAPVADVRHGVGWGPISVLSEEPRVEDGPGWWSAREAIEVVHAEETSGARGVRTAYRRAEGSGPDEGAINAALLMRDTLVTALGQPSVGALRGLLSGMSQREIAAELGVSASAVSQRVRRDGLAALAAADRLLAEVR